MLRRTNPPSKLCPNLTAPPPHLRPPTRAYQARVPSLRVRIASRLVSRYPPAPKPASSSTGKKVPQRAARSTRVCASFGMCSFWSRKAHARPRTSGLRQLQQGPLVDIEVEYNLSWRSNAAYNILGRRHNFQEAASFVVRPVGWIVCYCGGDIGGGA
ncbi:hypothetical protein EI94DRAFT_1128265 [Lactarius quietus]|nr:hypothetical protein EI94DRAFT_1128265 [Lactarius quietus]